MSANGLQVWLQANINKPEYQQRWPHYATRKAELIRMWKQQHGEAARPKESPSDKPKRKAKKKKK